MLLMLGGAGAGKSSLLNACIPDFGLFDIGILSFFVVSVACLFIFLFPCCCLRVRFLFLKLSVLRS